jgi:APA family basic amino acid/polyamine antiporter
MSQPASPGFQQRLGLFDATMLVAGTMIGSGIFIVSADIARDVGSSGWLIMVWVITALMTLMGALSYAELAAMMPKAGGQYVYLREAYSPMWGFLYGWTCFLVIQTGSIAAVGVAFAKFLGVLVPQLGTDQILWTVEGLNIDLAVPVPWMGGDLSFFKRDTFTISAGQLVAVFVVAVLTYVNTLGVQEGKMVQNIFTIAKTLGLILLIVAGFTIALSPRAVELNQENAWAGIGETSRYEAVFKIAPIIPLAIMLLVSGAMVGSLFAADAWNNITFTAGEIKNPRRNLPWSLALGVGMVVFLYILANFAYLSALPVHGTPELDAKVKAASGRAAKLEKMGLHDAAKAAREDEEKLLREASTFDRGIAYAKDDRVGTAVLDIASPNLGVTIMAIAIMISTFGCVNGMILMGARLYYAMARDRLFFQSTGRLNARGVPAVALVLQGIWSIALIFSGSYSELLDFVIFAVLVFYVLTVTGLFVLRRKHPDAHRPYKAFGYPFVPAFYVLLCAVISLALLVVKPQYSWPSFIIVLLGIPVYFLWPGKDTAQRQKLFDEEHS